MNRWEAEKDMKVLVKVMNSTVKAVVEENGYDEDGPFIKVSFRVSKEKKTMKCHPKWVSEDRS